ncbi:MAG: PAS domain S-box protein, partial [Calditrichaeota bacterium]
ASARILIAEDERIIAKDIQESLIQGGFEVAGLVSTGEKAVEAAIRLHPDLILMDIMLKGRMDGIHAAEAILKELDVPIIYLTAYADDNTVQRAKQTTPFGYLLKPFDYSDLHRSIEMALYKHKADRKMKELERFFDISLDFLCIIDFEGKLKQINEVFEKELGYSREELLDSCLYDFVHPEDRATAHESMQRLIQAGKPGAAFEFRLKRKHGSYIWLHWTANPVVREGILYFSGRNITREKKAYLNLREAERRYRDLFENAPVMYVITRNHGGLPIIVDCNKLFLQRLGYTREEVLHKPLADFYTWHSREEMMNGGYQRALEGRFQDEERRLLTRDGQVIDTLLCAVPERNARGKIYGTRAMFVDITDRNKAQSKLRQLYQYTESLREWVEHLNRARGVEQALDLALHGAMKILKSDRGAILLFGDKDRLQFKATSGLSNDYCQQIEQLPDWKKGQVDVEIFLAENIEQAELSDPLKNLLRAEKIRSLAYYPLVGESQLLGKFALYYDQPHAYSREEIHIGKVLAENLAITIRRLQAQELIQKSEQKYRSIFQNIAEGIYQSTVDGKFITVNPALVQMLGYDSEQEVLSLKLPDDLYVDPLDRDRLAEMVTEQGTLKNVEIRLKRKDGTPIRVLMNDRAVTDGKGNVLYFEGTLENITERKRLEDALHMAAVGISSVSGEQFFNSLVNHLAHALECEFAFIAKVRDKQKGEIESIAVVKDGQMAENFKYDFGEDLWAEVLKKEIYVLAQGAQNQFPQEMLLSQHSARGVAAMIMTSPEGKILGLLVAIGRRGFSNTGLAESILKIFAGRAIAELDRQIAEEEKKRLEAQIQDTQKLESLGVLAGGIAHDFNNLLAGILGNANLAALESPPGSPALESIKQIEIASQRAADLTKQLLAYSGRGKFVSEVIHLSDVVKEIGNLLQISISKKINLEYHLEGDQAYIEGDPSQIQQVVMNLITNASEAIG